MAAIKPLLPLSSPLKQTIPSFITPMIFTKPISDSFPSFPPISNCTQQQQQRLVAVSVSVSFNPSGNYELSLFEEENESPKVAPPMPPTEGRYEVVIDNDVIKRLDLTPFHNATGIRSPSSVEPKEFLERTIGFRIDYAREDEYCTRELSEYPDIRLRFVRLDAIYPWLPVLLDWRAGELARYAAMLVPHQISLRMGVVFNPEALQLFVMNKVFVVYSWLKQHKIPKPRLKTSDMARMLGFGIGNELFNLIDEHPNAPILIEDQPSQ